MQWLLRNFTKCIILGTSVISLPILFAFMYCNSTPYFFLSFAFSLPLSPSLPFFRFVLVFTFLDFFDIRLKKRKRRKKKKRNKKYTNINRLKALKFLPIYFASTNFHANPGDAEKDKQFVYLIFLLNHFCLVVHAMPLAINAYYFILLLLLLLLLFLFWMMTIMLPVIWCDSQATN